MSRFMIAFVLCCTMGQAHRWGYSQNVRLDSAITSSQVPHFENGPMLGLYPTQMPFKSESDPNHYIEISARASAKEYRESTSCGMSISLSSGLMGCRNRAHKQLMQVLRVFIHAYHHHSFHWPHHHHQFGTSSSTTFLISHPDQPPPLSQRLHHSWKWNDIQKV